MNWILKANDISVHPFDIMSKCFGKYISKHRNYPSPVYYAVNNHMYYVRRPHRGHVTDPELQGL